MTSPLTSPPPCPVALAPVPSNIPVALTAFDHFLLWDWELRQGRDGPVWTKPPLKVSGSGHAKSTDAAGWGSFRTAVNAFRSRRLPGFGFALAADDPFCFGDIDDCRNPETGEIAAWARPVLERLRGTYQEASPSGTGVKIIAQGKLPGSEHRWKLGPNPGEYVEWFDVGKYTTLTGHRLPHAGEDAVDCQGELDALYRDCFPPKAERTKPAQPNGAAETANLDDDAIVQKARNSRDGPRFIQLFDSGNTSLYGGDDSAADIALCGMLAFWFGGDADAIDRVFRRSALMRDKWAERADYRKLTIDKVLAGRTDFYTPRAPRRLTVVAPDAPAEEGAAPRRTRWTATDLLAADLPEPRWAVPDLIPEGLTILAGRPKKGKSRLALDIALSVASGLPALGHFDVDNGGDVLFAGLEDGPRRLQERLQDMLGKRPAPPTLELWIDIPKLGEGCEEAVERWIAEHPNARLIWIDTYQRIRKPATGRDGNPYAIDYQEAARLQTIAMAGRVAVGLILHTRKPVGGADPFDDVLGSTGNTAAADALMLLQTEHGRADAKLLVTGRDIEQAEHALASDSISGRWARIGQASDVRRSGQREAILSALRAVGTRGLKPVEIAHATKQRSGNVRYLLMRMKNEGEVSEHEGAYICTESRFSPNAHNALTLTVPEGEENLGGDRGNGETETVRGGETPNVSVVSGVRGVWAVSGVSGHSPWVCECGAEVIGHLAHCPACGMSRP